MVGFPKIEKMAIYNIQLFGKGGEVLVTKLNGRQYAYCKKIEPDKLAEKIDDDLKSNTPTFHIYNAVDMEDCVIKITNVSNDVIIQECNILDFVNEDSTDILVEFDLEDLDPDNYLCWALYSQGKFFDYDFKLDEVFNSTKMLFKMIRFEHTFYIRDIWYGDEHLSALPNSPTQSVFSDISEQKDYQDLTEMRKDIMIISST